MGITLTTRGSFDDTPPSTTASATSTSFTPAAGSILVVGLVCDHQGTDTTLGTCTVSDGTTFGDTAGGAWTQGPVTRRPAPITAGQFKTHAEIWTRAIGTGPGAGTVKVQANWTIGVTGGWSWGTVVELSGQAASPLGLNSGNPVDWTTAGPTTYTLSLGGTPATDSLVFSLLYQDNTLTQATLPSGYTVDAHSEPAAFGADVKSGYQNGSSPSGSPQWTGCDAAADLVGVALEIKAAAGLVTRAHNLVFTNLDTAHNW